MKKTKYLIFLLCLLLCFTSCSNLSENGGNSSDQLPNAIFESVDEIKNLVTAAKDGEGVYQSYRDEVRSHSGANLNIFKSRNDVLEFEGYIVGTEFPVVTEESIGRLNRMKIEYSNWERICVTFTYYIDEIRYMFSYYTNKDNKADVIPAEVVEREVQLDDIMLGLYKYEEGGLCVGHTIIGEYNVQITVMTLDIDAITFEHFTLEKILE